MATRKPRSVSATPAVKLDPIADGLAVALISTSGGERYGLIANTYVAWSAEHDVPTYNNVRGAADFFAAYREAAKTHAEDFPYSNDGGQATYFRGACLAGNRFDDWMPKVAEYRESSLKKSKLGREALQLAHAREAALGGLVATCGKDQQDDEVFTAYVVKGYQERIDKRVKSAADKAKRAAVDSIGIQAERAAKSIKSLLLPKDGDDDKGVDAYIGLTLENETQQKALRLAFMLCAAVVMRGKQITDSSLKALIKDMETPDGRAVSIKRLNALDVSYEGMPVDEDEDDDDDGDEEQVSPDLVVAMSQEAKDSKDAKATASAPAPALDEDMLRQFRLFQQFMNTTK